LVAENVFFHFILLFLQELVGSIRVAVTVKLSRHDDGF